MLRRVALAAGFALSLACSGGFAQADPNKIIHAMFPAAETGFDPQAARSESVV